MPLVATNLSVIPDKILYVDTPWYLSTWFYIGIAVILIAITVILYNIIEYRQKNRLIVEIDNPDKSFEAHVFKNFSGNVFHIKNREKTRDGLDTFTDYKFKPEYMITGKWGKRIRYDYGNPEPKNPYKEQVEMPMFIYNAIKFLESLANTTLLSELLIGSKFKEFVKSMLIIIVIEGVIIIGLVIAVIVIVDKINPPSIQAIANATMEACKSICSSPKPILK